MMETRRLAVPVFAKVTGWGALVVPTICGEKFTEAGDRDTAGAGVNPVPLRETRRLVPLVPFTIRSPPNSPFDGGANAMLKLQELPVGTPVALPGAPNTGHVLVCAYPDVV